MSANAPDQNTGMESEESTTEPTQSRFIYAVCQSAATPAARGEILKHENLKLAFSRRGFLTFKVDDEKPLPEKFTLASTLARTYGWSVGKVVGNDLSEMAKQVATFPELSKCKHIHVFERETIIPGSKGFEPGTSELARAVADQLKDTLANSNTPIEFNRVAPVDSVVFDIVLVQPNEWWLGYHYGTSRHQRWPGGVPTIDTGEEVISRAHFKLQEAIAWSGIPIREGDICAEIGSSPGGGCQYLLELGCKVIAIDPAELDESLKDHPKLTFVRRRGKEVRKRDLKDVRWLLADLNNTPNYTIDTIEEMVSNEHVDVTGLILTLKMTDWKLVEQIPNNMDRIRKLGFDVVKARQLAFNRQEYCLVAVKDRFVLRSAKKRKKKTQIVNQSVKNKKAEGRPSASAKTNAPQDPGKNSQTDPQSNNTK